MIRPTHASLPIGGHGLAARGVCSEGFRHQTCDQRRSVGARYDRYLQGILVPRYPVTGSGSLLEIHRRANDGRALARGLVHTASPEEVEEANAKCPALFIGLAAGDT